MNINLKIYTALIFCFSLLFGCSFAAAEAPQPNTAPDQFSIAWISDTQTLTEKPSLGVLVPSMFQWIVDTRKDYGTICVVHTGDIVENGWNERHWGYMNAGIDLLPKDLPFIPSAGNHDVAKKRMSYEPWFAQDFVKKQDPAFQYKNGEGYYQLFYPGNEKLVIVSIGYNSVDDEGMEWVRSTFARYPDHTGILVAHSFLSYINGRDSVFTKPGKLLYENVVVPCANVRLVLSGHIDGNDSYTVHLDHPNGSKRIVNMLRYDCQYAKYADLIGYLRLLRFDPADRSIEVMTYSPIQDNMHYHFAKPETEHFVLTNAF